MKCVHCNAPGKAECHLCYRMKNGMPDEIYHKISKRICSVYPVMRKRRKFKFPRPVGHPFCRNASCVAEKPSYTDFVSRANSLRVRKKGVIPENDYWKIVKKSCIFCGISPCNGVDRYDSSQGYVQENVLPSCFQCNIMKKNIDTNEFISKIADVCHAQGSSVRRRR